MTENVILFDELCSVLTGYEDVGFEKGATGSDLYGLLIKIQTQWKVCLSKGTEAAVDAATALTEKSCGVLTDWLAGAGPIECQAKGCHYTLIRVRKNAEFDYLYIHRQYYSAGIKRGSDFKYAGIFCKKNGRIYDGQYEIRDLFDDPGVLQEHGAEAIHEALKAAVRKAVEDAIGNDRRNLRITDLAGKRKLEDLAQFQNYTAKGLARSAYLKSNKGEDSDNDFVFAYVCKYSPENWTEDSMLAYILDPSGYVSAEADAYIDSHQEAMLSDFLEGDIVAAAYKALVENPAHPIHRVRRIIRAVSATSAKTVNVTIRRGGKELTFKAEADQFRSDCTNYYNDWRIAAADRKEFERVFGRGAHYGPEDILCIDYARSVLYEGEVVENE